MRVLLLTWMLLCLGATFAVAGEPSPSDRQLLVMLRQPAGHAGANTRYGSAASRQPERRTASALAREHGLTVLSEWPMPALGVDCFVMEIGPDASRETVLQTLAADDRVEWAQPMQVYKLLGAGDPMYAAQPAAERWHLRELHAIATGKGVVVAQVDSGVDLTHPDLRGQVAVARNFVPGQAFIGEAHGTEVAGIISARADNGIGIAGVAPDARLLALRACWQLADGSAQCDSFTLAQALQFALRSKTAVLNLSLSGPRDDLLGRLLDVALKQGITVVAAVDPKATDGGFPASHPGVLAVASEGDARVLADALMAPGHDIPTTTMGDAWAMASGPSFAAAQVSGLAALLRQLQPRLRPAEMRALLAPPANPLLAEAAPAVVNACASLERSSHRCVCRCGLSHGDGAVTGH